MRLVIAPYIMDIDVEKTQRYYEHGEDDFTCSCSGCRNFAQALPHFSRALTSLLAEFGLKPQNAVRVSAIHATSPETVLYEVEYHVCGEIKEGEPIPWTEIVDGRRHTHDEHPSIAVCETVEMFITSRGLYIVMDDFPRPVFALRAFMTLPWVLQEENTY